MPAPLRLLIDTDPGVDDAIALLMALRHPTTVVEAITVVAGNVGLDNTVRNARYLVELAERDVPVYAGAERALLREHRRAAEVHGDDGLGNLGLVPRDRHPVPGHAADALIERCLAEPGALTLVTLGPLTNIAIALLKEPRLAGAVRQCVMMGGNANVVGNVTPAAEFNIWADPDAARIVFRSGMPITMVGIEISRDCRLSEPFINRLSLLAGERARVSAALLGHSLVVNRRRLLPGDIDGAGCPDGTAMTVALDPDSVQESGTYYVDVETQGELTQGETVVDRRAITGNPPNTTVVHAIKMQRFEELVEAACRL